MSNCKLCGTEFDKQSYQQEYCSITCKSIASRKRQLEKKKQERLLVFEEHKIGVCPVCSKEFERTYSPTWKQQKYCSSSCRRKSEKISGQKSKSDSLYKDNIRFDGNKIHVLERDNHKCQFCKSKSKLIIHHIDGSGNNENPNNDMDNLVTLCRSCHARLHKYIETYKR